MLRDETEETTAIILRRGMDRIVLDSKEPKHELRVVAGINSVTPLYSGASGRVFMAWMAEAERDYIINATKLKPVTVHGATQPGPYLTELITVRAQGYASTVSDVTFGATAIAAPIFNLSGLLSATTLTYSINGIFKFLCHYRLAASLTTLSCDQPVLKKHHVSTSN